MSRYVTLALLLLVVPLAEAGAQNAAPLPSDRIIKINGKIVSRITVIKETAATVEIDTDGNGKADKTLDQNDIKTIQYGGKPRAFSVAESYYRAKQYSNAIGKFREVMRTPGMRSWVKDYGEYYIAMCYAKLAAVDAAQLNRATSSLEALLKNDRNRWRDTARYELGNVYLAAGDKPKALRAFTDLEATAHKDEMKLTASVGMGAILLAEGKAGDALKRYEKVISSAKGKFKDLYETATVGKAEALTALKRYDEAAKFIDGVLATAEGDDLLAKARLALADCYYAQARSLGDDQEARSKYKAALKNYLWCIVVFYEQKSEYAKSLLYAGKCWQKLGQEERAQELYKELRDKFSGTRWIKMI